jgi:hypothetical protein
LKYLAAVLFMLALVTPANGQQAAPSSATPAPASTGGFDPPVTPKPGPAISPTMIVLSGGTTVEVSLSEKISSANATVGDTVPTVVDREVDAMGFVAIPKGANGQATITQVDHAGGNGHGGKLALTIDWCYSADAGRILLSTINHSAGGEEMDKKGAASTATILSYALLGPLGLFAHNFVRGKDVTIDPTQTFNVFVDHDVHVRAIQKVVAAPGFDN